MRRSHGFSQFAVLAAFCLLPQVARATVYTVNNVTASLQPSPATVAQGITDVLTANGSGTPSSQGEEVPGPAVWSFSTPPTVQVQVNGNSWATADPSAYSFGGWSGNGSAQQTANITFNAPGTYQLTVVGTVTYSATWQNGPADPNDSWGGTSSPSNNGVCQITVLPITVTISGPQDVISGCQPQYTALALGLTGSYPNYSWNTLNDALQGPWSNGGVGSAQNYTAQAVGSDNIICSVTAQGGGASGQSNPYKVTVHNSSEDQTPTYAWIWGTPTLIGLAAFSGTQTITITAINGSSVTFSGGATDTATASIGSSQSSGLSVSQTFTSTAPQGTSYEWYIFPVMDQKTVVTQHWGCNGQGTPTSSTSVNPLPYVTYVDGAPISPPLPTKPTNPNYGFPSGSPPPF